MKKTVCLTILIVLILLLTSCIKGVDTMFFKDNDNDLADVRMKQVFTAIKAKDKEAIKSVFSKKALAETSNIDVGINYLLSFIQGEVISWNRDESSTVFDSNENGNKAKQLVTWFNLNTDEQNYLVFLVDYPIDTINPENEGLYSLRIIRAQDENNLSGTMEDWMIPGIYIPNE